MKSIFSLLLAFALFAFVSTKTIVPKNQEPFGYAQLYAEKLGDLTIDYAVADGVNQVEIAECLEENRAGTSNDPSCVLIMEDYIEQAKGELRKQGV